ncbi:MAG: lipopolysaccharide transport periplasmic protein LptA [Helicobacteraceae bacterium]|nr:lipopolysaccharide transport periplasmic protein LptA [Helicobacteraceae bacterium]
MRIILLSCLFLLSFLKASELNIVSDSYSGNQKKGVSKFSGNVKIQKTKDRLEAQSVTVYTDEANKPTKMVATGDVTFFVVAENNSTFKGIAQRVVYLPNKKEYNFFDGVELFQVNEKKTIKGEHVCVNLTTSQATAKGDDKAPVRMSFEIDEK